ncbi:MAG: glycosyltransferase family 4 protein [Thermoflexales bacterium]|nr:glycosyltransferase family 4 protein [Thermoflexales bacterium]
MRVAIVVPRYGVDVLGGAESQARGFAEVALKRGWEVEVWTTCARSHYTWENVYPEGATKVNGVTVRRFPVMWSDRNKWAELEVKLVQQGFLSPTETYTWLDSAPHSPSLYVHIARHRTNFDVIVALPYVMPLIHYAVWSAPHNVVLWPCLHDEPYAYLEATRLLLESVWGVMFNSPEEAEFALRRLKIHPHSWAVLGEGVSISPDPTPVSHSGLSGNFVLYVGRLEEGKNLQLLYEFMQRYGERRGGIRLVVVGGGPVKPPSNQFFLYLGFVSEEQKAYLYSNALVLCQPSLRESFSLTIMESWMAGRPVLVHEDCPVTREHVRRSKGGLWFRTYEEFAEALDWFRENPDLAARMGENGRRYVLANYTWEAVLDRFERLIGQWRGKQ